VRLPEHLAAGIEAEAQRRRMSKSDIVRERLESSISAGAVSDPLAAIADLIGSVPGLPRDLSRRKKSYLQRTGYGRRHR
jgi:hypothetical protein